MSEVKRKKRVTTAERVKAMKNESPIEKKEKPVKTIAEARQGITDRVLEVFKESGMHPTQFSESLCLDRSYIPTLRTRDVKVSDPVLKLIEYKYGVSLTWLKTGRGDKYIPRRSRTDDTGAYNMAMRIKRLAPEQAEAVEAILKAFGV